MSIFSIIGHFFSDLFSAAKRAWDKLPKPIQNSLLNGSGIINIINVGVNADPNAVAATITATYPEEVGIYDGLVSVAKYWGILPSVVPPDLPGIILLIQGYLKQVEESKWPATVSGAAGLLSSILAGNGTPFEIISTLLQYVYTTFIKPKAVTILPAPVASASSGLTSGPLSSQPAIKQASPGALGQVATAPIVTDINQQSQAEQAQPTDLASQAPPATPVQPG